jgi:hypothetical protein
VHRHTEVDTGLDRLSALVDV